MFRPHRRLASPALPSQMLHASRVSRRLAAAALAAAVLSAGPLASARPQSPAAAASAPSARPASASSAAPASPGRSAPAKAAPAAKATTASSSPASANGSLPDVDLAVEKVVLDNGLEVIFHEDHRTPVVAVNVWYHVGSKDEPAGRNGFAHLFEHMMFQGSKHVAEDTFFKYLERAGASQRNGSTNSDRTNYYETLPRNELALALWLESDRMGFLLDHAGQETFESQRSVVKNERRQNYENAPYGLVSKFMHEALFPKDHPYHLLTIGTPEDLDAAKLEDVQAFFRTFYLPNNATLVIAGDIDKAEAKSLVQKYFAPLAKGATPPVHKTPAPVTLTEERKLAIEADVELPRLQILWPTPESFAPGDAELDGAAAALAHGKSSRLYKRLVYDLQIAQDVSAFQSSSELASTFGINVTMKKGKDPKQALAIVDAELDKLRKAPITTAELDRVRPGLLAQLIFPLESVTSRAELFNHYNQATGDPAFLGKDMARYTAMTPASIQAAAAKYLTPHGRVVAIVTPTKDAPRAGRLAGGAS